MPECVYVTYMFWLVVFEFTSLTYTIDLHMDPAFSYSLTISRGTERQPT